MPLWGLIRHSVLQNFFAEKNSEISFFIVAPDKVTIKGPSDAKVGDSLKFECTTSNSNPPASVTWVVDGRSVNENFTHSVRSNLN